MKTENWREQRERSRRTRSGRSGSWRKRDRLGRRQCSELNSKTQGGLAPGKSGTCREFFVLGEMQAKSLFVEKIPEFSGVIKFCVF